MKIRLDKNNYILSYAVIGDVENSIEANLSVEDFNNLPCFLYKFENGILTLDEEKKKQWEEEQNQPEPEPEPEPTGEYVTYDELAKAIKEGVNSYGK